MINLSTNKEYQSQKQVIEVLQVSNEEKKQLKFELWMLHIGNINTFDVI